MSVLFNIGRVLLGMGLVADGVWNLATWDLRAAYLDLTGAPHIVTALTAFVLIGAGLAIAIDRAVKPAAAAAGLMLLVVSLVLFSDPNGKGIGEYPPEFHFEVIFKEWVVHIAIMGALLFLAQTARGEALSTYAKIGRAIIGIYFLTNAGWQIAYYDIRIEHLQQVGSNPNALPIVIGMQILCGLLVIAGRFLWVGIVPLVVVITASTVAVHGDLSPTAPYPANLQIHQWFVKGDILAGLLMILGHHLGARRPRSATGSTVPKAAHGIA